MQPKKTPNIQVTGRKGTASRMGTHQNVTSNQQQNTNLNAIK